MLQERIEPAWTDTLEAGLRRRAHVPRDMVSILGDTLSHPAPTVLAEGDVPPTFMRHLEHAMTRLIQNHRANHIESSGVDARWRSTARPW